MAITSAKIAKIKVRQMAKLQQHEIPGVGIGIQHPKLKNRFAVKIKCGKADNLDCLTQQIVAVKKIIEDRNVFFGIESGTFRLIVEDDVQGLASRAIHSLRLQDFSVEVMILDGTENVIETTTFGGCRVQQVRYSDLDYAAPSSGKFINVDIPNKVGNAVELLKENHPEAYAIFLALSGTNISMHTRGESAAVHHELVISFDKLSKEFH